MALFARRTGDPLTPRQHARIVWELDKYAPAFCEAPGASIHAYATQSVDRTLQTAQSFGDFLEAGKHHGTRILRKRDRATLTWAVCAAVRTAATDRQLDEYDAHFFHDVFHGSEGAFRVEGTFGRVELGEIDAIRHQKDPKGLEAYFVAPDADQMRWRLSELGKKAGLPPRFGWGRGPAFAFLTCGALNVGHDASPRPAALELAEKLHAMAVPMGYADKPLVERDHQLARASALMWQPNDPTLFLRAWEDNLCFFVDLPRERQDLLLKSLNTLVADAADITPYRRELITVAMAVLALGASAQWRPRPPPPAVVHAGE
jgi:hypothetical protein